MQNHFYFTKQDLTYVHCGLALQKRSRRISDHNVFHYQDVGRLLQCMARSLFGVKSEEVIIKQDCLLWAAASAARETEHTSIRLSRSMPRALSREHTRKREDHTKEGASLVGGHQKKRFSLSGFQERAHFSLFPLTPFLMLYSSACPPWTSVYCCLWLSSSEGGLLGLSDQMKYGIQCTF